MSSRTRPLTARISVETFDRLDRFVAKQAIPVRRTAVVEAALVKFLDEQEPAEHRHLTPGEQKAAQMALRRSARVVKQEPADQKPKARKGK